MTAKDWATFGEFIRRNGDWNGVQVIDKQLLTECFRGTEQNPAYGLTWWLKEPITAEGYQPQQRLPIANGDINNLSD